MLQGTEDSLLFTVNDGMAGENKVRYSRLASLL